MRPKLRARLHPIAELLAQKDEPIKWLAKKVVVPGTNLLGGGPKAGKSVYALQLGAAVALGGDFLGHKTRRCGVIYLSYDEPSRTVLKRQAFAFIRRNPGIPLYLETDWPVMAKGGLEQLRDTLLRDRNIGLVIIDTFFKFLGRRGGASYAVAAEAMGEFCQAVEDVGGDVGILMLHHLTKRGTTDRRMPISEAFYGSNAVPGGVRNLLRLTKLDALTPREGPYVLEVEGRTTAPHTESLMRRPHYFQELADPDDDEEEESHAFEWVPDPHPIDDFSPLNRAQQIAMRVLGEKKGPMTAGEIVRAVKETQGYSPSYAYVCRQLVLLCKAGLIVNLGDGKHPVYELPLPEDPVRHPPKSTDGKPNLEIVK
jgi:hypothetical protein